VQERVNVLVIVSAPVDSPVLLESALLPDHAPEARQEVALVDDQVSVEAPPLATDVGFATSDTEGADPTVTVADALAVPPVPVQERVNVLVIVSTPVDCPVLESGLLPDHAPDATQEVALADDQVSVEDPPLATDAGFATSDTVGAGTTVTVADAPAVPPAPVQERVNVLVTVSGPVDCPVLLESALLPDHAPEAVQEVALLDDQVSVEDPPLATDVGFAASDTVGAGGGGGMPDTATLAEAFVIPPRPVQVRE